MGYYSTDFKTEDCFEIWLMTSQNCNLTVNEYEYNINKGDIFIFKKDDVCKIESIDSTSVFTVLRINCNFFLNSIPKSTVFGGSDFFGKADDSNNILIRNSENSAKIIFECLEKSKKAFASKDIGYEFVVMHHTIIALLATAHLKSNYDYEKKETGKRNSAADTALKKAVNYIDTHLSDDLTLEKISAVAGLTPNYFSNIFKVQTGVKLWDYISEKRILLATRLLVEYPDESVISIAIKCGYNNCPNFNRAFKKFTGLTPKKYKNSIQRQEPFNGN